MIQYLLNANRRNYFRPLILLQILILSVGTTASRGIQDAPSLELGKPIERDLVGDQAHSYSIALTSGQFMHLVVNQRGIDVVVSVFAPENKKLVEVDSPNGTQGPEPVSLIADTTGIYRIEVRSPDKAAPAGRYEVKIEELRTATQQDKTRLKAVDLFTKAMNATNEGTAESFHRAITGFEEAIPLLREIGDGADEAIALNQIGFIYKLLGEKQKALEYLNRALPIRRTVNDRDGEGATLLNIGAVYDDIGEKQKALEYYNQALPLFRAVGDAGAEAITYNNIGLVYDNLGEKQKALEFYEKALPVLHSIGNQREEANTLTNIAVVYDNLGERTKAIGFYEQALRIQQPAGDRSGQALTLSNLGLLYDRLGEKQKALTLYDQALPLFRVAGNRRGEANLMDKVGSVYSDIGESQKAMDSYNEALVKSRSANDRAEEATALNNLGLLYDRLGEKQKALGYYDQALTIQRAIGARRTQGITLNNIALVYDDLNQKDKALDYYNQALVLYRSTGYRSGEANTLHNIAAVYRSLGDEQKAVDFYNQALPIRRAVGDRTGEAFTLLDLGQVYESLGETRSAFDFYTQSLTLYRAVARPVGESNALAHLARLERERGNLNQALVQIEAAITIVESLRTKIGSQELRSSFFATFQNYFEFYIDLLMRLHKQNPTSGFDAKALQASERRRARSLLEVLAEAKANIRQGIDTRILDRERSLQVQLNAKAQEQVRLLNGKHTDAQSSAIAVELDALTAQFDQIETEIKQSNPRYAALTQPQPLSLKEIQTQVLDKDTLLLQYSLGPDRSYLWVVTPDSINSFELPKRDEIETVARHVYELINARNQNNKDESKEQRAARISSADAELKSSSQKLSQLVLGPVGSVLGNKRLLIIGDGGLLYVPFAALPDPASTNASPLITRHEVINAPSASTIALLRRELAGRAEAPKTIAVLADPVFESRDERLKEKVSPEKTAVKQSTQPESTGRQLVQGDADKSAQESGLTNTELRIPRLPGTRKEAEQIVALVPPGGSKLALDFAANRATATNDDLSEYRYIHFATHGFLNSSHPELSGLVFSMVDEKGQPQDGFLRAHEIFNLKLPAELVVLSACQTGLGKEIKGEGLASLTRGFMYAGARRVVVSLWSVNDIATAELMERFYKGILTKHLPPAAALRAAQLDLKERKEWSSPFYWAAFTVQGEWR